MTGLQRIQERLRGEPVDRIPNLSIVMAFAARFHGVTYDRFAGDAATQVEANLKTASEFGIDVVTVMSDPWVETVDLGGEIEYLPDAIPSLLHRPVVEPADAERLKLVDPRQGRRMANRLRTLELYRELAGDRFAIVGWVEGCLAEACDVAGVATALEAIYLEPAWLSRLLDFLLEQELWLIREQASAGAHIIGIGESVGSLISPEHFRRFVLPYEQRLVEAIHEAGLIAKLHICGDTSRVLGMMCETGADIVDIDWMVDMGRACRIAAGRCSINGNFDPVAVLLQGMPEDVAAAVQACCEASDDRLMISPGCEVPKDTPYANMRAIEETLREMSPAVERSRRAL